MVLFVDLRLFPRSGNNSQTGVSTIVYGPSSRSESAGGSVLFSRCRETCKTLRNEGPRRSEGVSGTVSVSESKGPQSSPGGFLDYVPGERVVTRGVAGASVTRVEGLLCPERARCVRDFSRGRVKVCENVPETDRVTLFGPRLG